MRLNCLLYTTYTIPESDLETARRYLAETKGRSDVAFTVRSIPSFPEIPTIKDEDGHIRPQWEWFEREFVKPLGAEYNAVGFHFTKREKERWGITLTLNGSYHRNADNIIDFWFCADLGVKARHYRFSEIVRLLVHEVQHGDVHWTSAKRELVHQWDYEKHAIHKLPRNLSYRRYDVLVKQLAALLDKFRPMKRTLLDECAAALGKDITPDDLVPDTVACAITVSTLISKIDPTFPKVAGTWTLYDILEHRPDFERVTVPAPGTIVISPTGTGNGAFPGHVGIVGANGKIMSNDSRTGTFEENYNLMTWEQRYARMGGFPVLYYRRK